jgi:hypothetical protein
LFGAPDPRSVTTNATRDKPESDDANHAKRRTREGRGAAGVYAFNPESGSRYVVISLGLQF